MNRRTTLYATVCLLVLASPSIAEETIADKSEDQAKLIAAARKRGLDWLNKHQAENGSWGKTYSIAVTSFACLSYLGDTDEPFQGERGRKLLKGLQFLMANQKDGQFNQQGHTWIHGQGFATLALSEAYGRSLFVKAKPDYDMSQVRDTVGLAVKVIAEHQSHSGGWWYTQGGLAKHEGSTTVCAVQALVSARNYGVEIDNGVLARGFEYLKKCQNADGGFDYKLGDATSMKEGTAAGVATLGLMKKFDYSVMIDGYEFLLKNTPSGISSQRFPYYGHFYGCMGMHLLRQEFGRDKEYREQTSKYIADAHKDVLSWQQADGAWPERGYVKSDGKDYGTAFATLLLTVPESRLSIYNRRPPKLP